MVDYNSYIKIGQWQFLSYHIPSPFINKLVKLKHKYDILVVGIFFVYLAPEIRVSY